MQGGLDLVPLKLPFTPKHSAALYLSLRCWVRTVLCGAAPTPAGCYVKAFNHRSSLVNACVSTQGEQTNTVGKELTWEDKHWGKLQKAQPGGPPSSQLCQPRSGMQVLGLEPALAVMH